MDLNKEDIVAIGIYVASIVRIGNIEKRTAFVRSDNQLVECVSHTRIRINRSTTRMRIAVATNKTEKCI